MTTPGEGNTPTPTPNLPPVNLEVVKNDARDIVASGRDVRDRIAQLVTDAARQAQASGQGLLGLVRSVVDGAASAAGTAAAGEPGSALNQVTEALGDGINRAALSARLALEEARSRGERFASEDLTALRDDLADLRDMFAQTVSHAGSALGSTVKDQAGGLREHAERVMERVRPSLDAALTAVKEHPAQLGQESLEAGVSLARQAAGSLFHAIGRGLQQAGDAIKGQTRI